MCTISQADITTMELSLRSDTELWIIDNKPLSEHNSLLSVIVISHDCKLMHSGLNKLAHVAAMTILVVSVSLLMLCGQFVV